MAEDKQEENKQELNEPQVHYGAVAGKKIRIYYSFEEAAEAEAFASAEQSPEDRIRETVELILRVYGVSREELKSRKLDKHIKIIHYE